MNIHISSNHFFDNFAHNKIKKTNFYNYQIATQKHENGIVEIFTESFCNSEPMTRYLNINPKLFRQFTCEVTKNAIKDGLSIVALDNNKVIACALIEDIANMREVPIDFDPNFKYIIGLLEKLGENFFKDKVFLEKTIAHLFITAVSSNYQNQGLSTQVNFRAMNLARQNDFKFIYSELTNQLNTKGIINHLKNKNRIIGSCIYDQFEMDGIKPFANLAGRADGYLWEIKKDALLRYLKNGKLFTEKL